MPEFYAPRANPSPAAYGPYDVGIYPYLNQLAQQLGQAGRARQAAMAQDAARRAQEEYRKQQLALAQDREKRMREIEESLYGPPKSSTAQGEFQPDIPGELGGPPGAPDGAPTGGLRGQAQQTSAGRAAETARHNRTMEDLARQRAAAIAGRGGGTISPEERLDQQAFTQAGQQAVRVAGGGQIIGRTPNQQAALELAHLEYYMRTRGANPKTVQAMDLLSKMPEDMLKKAAASHPQPLLKSYAKLLLMKRSGLLGNVQAEPSLTAGP